MDCGPAALQALVRGFGLSANYEELRARSGVGLDGTSIDMLEDLLTSLGFRAEQRVVPIEHLLARPDLFLPCIVVTRTPDEATHFVVLWRCHLGRFQVMDPAWGRRWTTARTLRDELYVHSQEVLIRDWLDWVGSEDFLDPLRTRCEELGVPWRAFEARWTEVRQRDWREAAEVEAVLRLIERLRSDGVLPPGWRASRLFEEFMKERACPQAVPPELFQVRPAASPDDLVLRGAVVLHVAPRGLTGHPLDARTAGTHPRADSHHRPSVWSELFQHSVEGCRWPWLAASGACLLAVCAALEPLLFRSLIDLPLESPGARAFFAGMLSAFLCVVGLLEYHQAKALLSWATEFEVRLRLALFRQLPRLQPEFFSTRLPSDLSERFATLFRLRGVPMFFDAGLRSSIELVVAAFGVAMIEPGGLAAVTGAVVAGLGLPVLALPRVRDRERRVQSSRQSLARIYFDALVGRHAIEAHGASATVRGEHERALRRWGERVRQKTAAVSLLETTMHVVVLGCIMALVVTHLSARGASSQALLLAYWGLSIFMHGHILGVILSGDYPSLELQAHRILELLGQREPARSRTDSRRPKQGAPTIELDSVELTLGGVDVLRGVSLDVAPGEHVALLGPSGAGKSSLIRILLGLSQPTGGRVRIDGRPPSPDESSHHRTVWVAPDVEIWDQSLLRNLRYGFAQAGVGLVRALCTADLLDSVAGRGGGLERRAGERGEWLSGGEGQRLRLGRGLLHPRPDLVLFDEAFRGLDLRRRNELLRACLEAWRAATIVCVTHDREEAKLFDRFVLLEHGAITRAGVIDRLEAAPSRDVARGNLGRGGAWRHLEIREGRLDGP